MTNRALVLDDSSGSITAELKNLPATMDESRGDVFVKVLFSSLNYKDGLAVTGKGKIVRAPYPFVPGIDLVGEVVTSRSSQYAPGDYVIGTGWQIGEAHWGGYCQYQTVRSEWLVPLPSGMTPEESMIVGTAGFTAMLAVIALENNGVTPGTGEVVVTGATGGVGSMSVALLARLGYSVVGSTGKKQDNYLTGLGVADVIHRSELSNGPYRPLDSGRWAGAIDSVGGTTLATILSQMNLHGSVAACGLAASHKLDTTVFPFILRGVNLLGIDSNYCPYVKRKAAWDRVADLIDSDLLNSMKEVVRLEDVPSLAERITNGHVRGRIVVDTQN
jgi:acrylyl-CoA reductase (NADPH)